MLTPCLCWIPGIWKKDFSFQTYSNRTAWPGRLDPLIHLRVNPGSITTSSPSGPFQVLVFVQITSEFRYLGLRSTALVSGPDPGPVSAFCRDQQLFCSALTANWWGQRPVFGVATLHNKSHGGDSGDRKRKELSPNHPISWNHHDSNVTMTHQSLEWPTDNHRHQQTRPLTG